MSQPQCDPQCLAHCSHLTLLPQRCHLKHARLCMAHVPVKPEMSSNPSSLPLCTVCANHPFCFTPLIYFIVFRIAGSIRQGGESTMEAITFLCTQDGICYPRRRACCKVLEHQQMMSPSHKPLLSEHSEYPTVTQPYTVESLLLT